MIRLAALLVCLPLAAAAQIVVPDGFDVEDVAGGFDRPVALDHLPDGRVLVAEQKTGAVYLILADDTPVASAVLTVPDLETGNNEAGLLSLAIDPAWPARPYVYCHYTATNPREMRLTRYTASGTLDDPQADDLALGAPVDLLTGLTDTAGNHNGGSLRFGPDGFLYFTVGDDERQCDVQDLSSFNGKVLRLRVDALGASGPVALADLVAPGNPYAGQGPVASLVWASGFRNPFRAAMDAQTGELFVGDVGEITREEISRVASGGENLGWPFREGTVAFSPPSACDDPQGATFLEPIWDYGRTEGASVVAGFVYRAPDGAERAWPEQYEGDFFFCDFYQSDLRRLTGSGQDWSIAPAVAGQPAAADWADGLASAADFSIAPDGSVVFVSLAGTVHRIAYVGPVRDDATSFGRLRARFRN